LVAAGVAVLLCLPVATSTASSAIHSLTSSYAPVPAARELVEKALRSTSVQYTGLAQSTGALGFPDLPQLGDVAAQLGGTTRTRVWWAGSQAWRVAAISPTGEQDIYQHDAQTVLWDYEQARLTAVVGTSPVRLPRADDLLPPQAARRVLGGLGPDDQVTSRPGHRMVAGVRAVGIRIKPGDPRSTIGHVDLWLDPDNGLPVAIEVLDTRGVTAIRSAFLDLSFRAPDAGTLKVPSPPGAIHDVSAAPDLAARLQRFTFFHLPDHLAGLAASTPIVGGTGTYGSGLVAFAVLPLPGRLAGQVLSATRSGGGVDLKLPEGQALLVSSGLVNLVVVRSDDSRRSFLLAGLVSSDVLKQATQELLQLPRQDPFGGTR
jgi:hypothetical protein